LVENAIFDNKRTKYVFVEKWNSVIITDENGNQLAKAKGSSLFDNDGSLILKTQNKTKLFSKVKFIGSHEIHSNFEITDSEGNVVGIFQQDHELSFLKNSKGEDLVIGEFPVVQGSPYGINDGEGNNIADVTRKKNERFFDSGKLLLHVNDLLFDRKTLLAFMWKYLGMRDPNYNWVHNLV